MMRLRVFLPALAVAAMALSLAPRADAQAKPATATNDKADIQALMESYMDAFRAKDASAIMANYLPDKSLVVFDVIPPRQYVGWHAYKRDWEGFLALYAGEIKVEMTELSVITDGNLGFTHAIVRSAGAMKDGKPLDLTIRLTDCLRKVKGKWYIVHEHVSVPVDILTGQADLTSKP
jgi:ketosteroid isomerase-like protein